MIFFLSFIIIFIFFVTAIKAGVIKSKVRLDMDSVNLITPLAFVSTLGVLGVVSNTSYYLDIPVEFMGIGEDIEDFEIFDPELYINSIIGMMDE